MNEAAFIARWFPGFGDPLLLPIDIFNGLLKQIPAMLKIEKGHPDAV